MSNKVKPAEQYQQLEESSHQMKIPLQRQQKEESGNKSVKEKEMNSKKTIKFKVEIQHRIETTQNEQDNPLNQLNQPIIPDRLQNQSSAQQKLCKICLDEGIFIDQVTDEQSSKKVLITPCLCSGSIKYVHDECMKQWVWKQVKKNKYPKLDCQICHKRINYKMKTNVQFICSKDYCRQNLSAFHICTFLFLIFALITISIILQLPEETIIVNQSLKTVLIVMIALTVLGVITVLALITRQCFFTKRKQIEHVYSYDEWQEILSRSYRTIRGSARTIRSQSNFPSRRTFNSREVGIRDINPRENQMNQNPSIDNIPPQLGAASLQLPFGSNL